MWLLYRAVGVSLLCSISDLIYNNNNNNTCVLLKISSEIRVDGHTWSGCAHDPHNSRATDRVMSLIVIISVCVCVCVYLCYRGPCAALLRPTGFPSRDTVSNRIYNILLKR